MDPDQAVLLAQAAREQERKLIGERLIQAAKDADVGDARDFVEWVEEIGEQLAHGDKDAREVFG